MAILTHYFIRRHLFVTHTTIAVADPEYGGRGGVNLSQTQDDSPCSTHEVASGGWVREGGVPPPFVDENGNQEILRGLLKHTKIRILYG